MYDRYSLHCQHDIMMMFVKHCNLYLPTGWEVSKYPVRLPVTSDSVTRSSSMVCEMTLFTAEQKNSRIRHNFLYVKM